MYSNVLPNRQCAEDKSLHSIIHQYTGASNHLAPVFSISAENIRKARESTVAASSYSFTYWCNWQFVVAVRPCHLPNSTIFSLVPIFNRICDRHNVKKIYSFLMTTHLCIIALYIRETRQKIHREKCIIWFWILSHARVTRDRLRPDYNGLKVIYGSSIHVRSWGPWRPLNRSKKRG